MASDIEKSLMFLAASILPLEELLKNMQEAIANYTADKTEENKRKLEVTSVLITINIATNGDIKKCQEMIQRMDSVSRIQSQFNTN